MGSQAASQLDLCSATQMEEFSVPPTLPCHDLSQDGGCQQDETAAYANSKCGPEHVAALEVPGQPTASLRLHKAKIRVCLHGLNQTSPISERHLASVDHSDRQFSGIGKRA